MSSSVSMYNTNRKILKRRRSDDENEEDEKNGNREWPPRKLCKHTKHNRERTRTTHNCTPRSQERNAPTVSRRRFSTPGRPRVSKDSQKEMNPWVADFLSTSLDDSNTSSNSSFDDIHNNSYHERISLGSIREDSHGPLLGSYQMLGDSLFVRFAEQILKERAVIGENGKFSNGNCVSGQTIQGLIMKLRLSRHLLEPNVIVLIGTNDFLKKSSVDEMKSCMQRLLSILSFRSQNIILLTVPPIPRLEYNLGYWDQWEAYNKWLMTLDNGSALRVIDIGHLFLLRSRTPDMAAYERYMGYGNHRRIDHIHLNKEGLLRLNREIYKLVDMQSDCSDWDEEDSSDKKDV